MLNLILVKGEWLFIYHNDIRHESVPFIPDFDIHVIVLIEDGEGDMLVIDQRESSGVCVIVAATESEQTKRCSGLCERLYQQCGRG